MVAACKRKYPNLEFVVADASNMNMISDDEYDVAVFSFNGIDYLNSDALRARCLREIRRVIRLGGIFIFSSHNARALAVWPQLRDAHGYQFPWRILRAIFKSLVMIQRSLRSDAFYAGSGYILDPVHKGLDTYTSTPAVMAAELKIAGFEIIETIGHYSPTVSSPYLTPWYHYACRKK